MAKANWPANRSRESNLKGTGHPAAAVVALLLAKTGKLKRSQSVRVLPILANTKNAVGVNARRNHDLLHRHILEIRSSGQ
jgi:hypothetical protein